MGCLDERTKQDFLVYANSVIKSRAIPKVEDNLKPIHRRILWSMYENKYLPNKPTVKSAKVVGNVMGSYHPHGDSSIYEALVRLSQWWKIRYPLVIMQGNNGNIFGDKSAASRYTESKLSEIGLLMVEDANKESVDFNHTIEFNSSVARLNITAISSVTKSSSSVGENTGKSPGRLPCTVCGVYKPPPK